MYEHGEIFDLRASPYNMDVMACSSRSVEDGRSQINMLSLPKTAEDVDAEFEYVNAAELLGQYKTYANDVNDYQYDDPLLSI